jgi:DNA repair protein RecN (Recombination protein N)
MLTHLQIRDFAIIDAVELELRPGLTVLTGETGAGKSILVDALQLHAGGRAGAEVVRHGAERAEVAGTLDLSRAPRELKQWLEEQAVSVGGELQVRRVVGADGRSRAYLNGQAVAVQLLREAGSILIDIHGQHEFQSLTRSAAQRELLDGYAGLNALTSQVGIAHRGWLELLNRTLDLETRARDRDAKLELLRYQAQELAALQLAPGELERLTEEHARLANRGRLAEGAQGALALLYEDEGASAHGAVSRALTTLKGLAALDAKLAPVLPRMLGKPRSRCAGGTPGALARAGTPTRRAGAAERRWRRSRNWRAHRVRARVRRARRALRGELARSSAEEDPSQLRWNSRRRCRTTARRRSSSPAAPAAARALVRDIKRPCRPRHGRRALRSGRHPGTATPTQHGIDQIEFRSARTRPAARARRGGLRRGALASVTAVQVSCPGGALHGVREVDAGIGGAVAEIVGRELRALGARGQVLCVTHLPQVASQAHHHLRVMKLTDGRTTRTTLTELSVDQRVEELARMLGGIEVSAKAREHARDMPARAPRARAPDTVRTRRPPASRRR